MLFKFFLELVMEGKRIGSPDFHVIDIDSIAGIVGGVMISDRIISEKMTVIAFHHHVSKRGIMKYIVKLIRVGIIEN